MRVLIIFSMALAVSGLATLGVQAATPDESYNKAGCVACHLKDKKLLGPSFKDVAAKYKGQGDVVAKLMEKVRKGGVGVYGPIPMPANPVEKINDADLKALVEFMLKVP
jgi:cytochrome c